MSLRRAAISAGRWTASSSALRAGLQLMQAVVLARILDPADFGLMAIATAVLAILSLFSDVGVSRALIHFDDVGSEVRSTLFWINLGVALVLTGALAACAGPVAHLFRSAELAPVLLMASPLFLLNAAGQQFRVLAEKDLRFGALARNEVGAAMIGFSASLLAALAGWGVQALVLGVLATSAASSLFAWMTLSQGIRPGLHFRPAESRPLLHFGAFLVGSNALNTLNRQADAFIGGLVASPAALGLYSLPRDLSLRIATVVNPVLTRIGLPVLARVKNDREKLRSIYLQTLRMTASVNFPTYFALAAFAGDITILLFGERWSGAAPYLRVLAAWGLLRSVSNPVGGLLVATGQARLAMHWNAALLAITVPLLVAGGMLAGLEGLALGLVLTQLAFLWPAWRWLVHPLTGAGFGEYLMQILVPLLASAVAAAVALLVARTASDGTVRLLIGLTSGVASYVLMSAWCNREWLQVMRQLLLPRTTD